MAPNRSHPCPRPRERGGLGRGAAPCHRRVRGESCVSGAPSPRSRARAMACAGRAVPSGTGHGPPRARPRLVPVHAAPRGFPAVAAAAVAVGVLPRSRARAGPRAPDCGVAAPSPVGGEAVRSACPPCRRLRVLTPGFRRAGGEEGSAPPPRCGRAGRGSGSVVPAGVSGSLRASLPSPSSPRYRVHRPPPPPPPPAAPAGASRCAPRALPVRPAARRSRGGRALVARRLLSRLTALLPG